MKILALETTDRIASVALLEGGQVTEITADGALRHAESVLPAVDELMNRCGVGLEEVDAFAVDVGPGSFTGVRIGVTMANALASAFNKPVISVNSLYALAYPFRFEQHPCAAIIDALNGNGYAALFEGERCLIEPCACVIDEFLSRAPFDCIFVGTGTENKTMPTARDVALFAEGKEGRQAASPEYLRQSQAERMWKGK